MIDKAPSPVRPLSVTLQPETAAPTPSDTPSALSGSGLASTAQRGFDALTTAIEALQKRLGSMTPAERAREVLACVSHRTVDFRRLDNNVMRDVLCLSGSVVWSETEMASARKVHLPLPLSVSKEWLPRGVQLMNSWRALERIEMEVYSGRASDLDLSTLDSRAWSICLHLNDYKGLQSTQLSMMAPVGSQVRAEGATSPSLMKSTVRQDGKDLAGKVLTMAGIPYWRKVENPCSDDAPAAASEKRLSINFNGESVDRTGTALACRHLSTRWLQMRREHAERVTQYAKALASGSQAAQKPVFTTEALSSKTALAKLDASALMEVRDEMLKQKGWLQTRFEPKTFGSAIADRFIDMKIGDRRHYGISFGSHYMALELAVKPSRIGDSKRSAFVATVYDPNITTAHVRLVEPDPGEFKSRPLAHWVDGSLYEGYVSKKRKFDEFSAPGTETGELYPYPVVRKKDALEHFEKTTLKHDLLGKGVELSDDKAAADACRSATLTARYAARLENGAVWLLCEASYRPSADGLIQFAVEGSTFPTALRMPTVLAEALLQKHALYWIPATRLTQSPPSRASAI